MFITEKIKGNYQILDNKKDTCRKFSKIETETGRNLRPVSVSWSG